MRYTHLLPSLPFQPGTVVFSPGITAALPLFPSLGRVIDHFMECHVATDFGVVSRATRFDNTLAALMDYGQLTSRYFLPSHICPSESGIIITTHLDVGTTTIRFAGEQE